MVWGMIRVHHTYCLLYFSCYQPHQLYLRSSDRPRRLGTLQHGFGMLCSLPLSSILWESLLSTIIRNTWMVRNIVISENEPTSKTLPPKQERPQQPPDLSRMANEFQKSHHSQYQAVIARMKQAEMQARRFGSQPAKQG